MTEPALNPSAVLFYSNLQRTTLDVPLMRSGWYLVTTKLATLPPLCPICGAPGDNKPVQLRIKVVQSFSFSLIRNPQDVLLTATFCPKHHMVRNRAHNATVAFVCMTIFLALMMIVLEIASLVFIWESAVTYIFALLDLGLCFMLLAGLSWVIATRGPRRHHSEGDCVYLAGVHPNLLEKLPNIPPRPRIR